MSKYVGGVGEVGSNVEWMVIPLTKMEQELRVVRVWEVYEFARAARTKYHSLG